MRRDLIAEGRLLRNVVDALRLALDERPEGCRESVLCHGVEACGVAHSRPERQSKATCASGPRHGS